MKFKALLKIIKKVGPLRLIFLIVLIVSNSFAWFIYSTKINSNVSVHVRSWNIVFEANNTPVSNTVNISVDSVYPGMDDYSYVIRAYNNSEVTARLTYKLLEANVLGTSYVTTDGRAELGESPQATDISSSELESILANDYPFTISIDISNDLIDEEDGLEEYSLNVVWPYESNDDETDTYWGVEAYNYKESNPGEPSITLKIKIIITQNLD